jgi:PAS domain S-box-containing protein
MHGCCNIRQVRERTLGLIKMNEALSEFEVRFRTLVEQVKDYAIFMTDAHGRPTSWNEGVRRVLGFEEAEFIGQDISPLIFTPEDLERRVPQREMEEAATKGTASDDRWMMRKNGTRFWASGITTGLRDADMQLLGFTKVMRDQTERKQAEEALRESEKRLRTAFEIETVGVIFFDVAGQITNANDAFLRMSGFSRDDLQAGRLRWDELTPPEWMPASERAIAELKSTGRTTPYEKEYYRKDGSRWWALFAAKAVREDEGVEFILDITERKQAEKALRETEERLRTLVQNVRDYAIFMIDPDGFITDWTEGAERVKGYTAEEAIGRHVSIFYTPEDVVAGEVEREIGQAAEEGRAEREYWRVRKGGQRFWANEIATAIRDAAGKLVGFTKISRDLSERKQAEEKLKEADRRKDEFLATLAHELRNPLAPLRNALEILRVKEADREGVSRVRETMEQQVTHLARLVDDLLEVSRITRGKIELRRERVELKEIVQSAVEMSRPLIDASRNELSIKLPHRPVYVEADSVRLIQIIANLVNNAVKYTERAGHIELTVAHEGADAVLRVRDNGIGIQPDLLPKIFDLFAQVDASSTRAQGGLGIGLTLVKHLVELHGGSVEAHSEGLGQGSEFIVRLPIAADDQSVTETQPKTPDVPLSTCRILVVDDNSAAADTLAELLRLYGNEVQVVHDGQAALQVFEEWRPDVMVLDIGMPGMDGYEVARRVRRQAAPDEVMLIAATGWGQEKDRELAREAGFNHHLLKPLDLHKLQGMLRLVRPPGAS